MKYTSNPYLNGILINADAVKKKTGGNRSKFNLIRVMVLVFALFGIFALTACNGDAMVKCQEKNSYDTCAYTLR